MDAEQRMRFHKDEDEDEIIVKSVMIMVMMTFEDIDKDNAGMIYSTVGMMPMMLSIFTE